MAVAYEWDFDIVSVEFLRDFFAVIGTEDISYAIVVVTSDKIAVSRNRVDRISFLGSHTFSWGCVKLDTAAINYKNGALATNGELIGVMWYGDPDKQNLLRKHVKDLRDRFEEIDAEDVLIKKRGSIGINMKKITVEGDTSAIVQQFGWIL